MTKSEKERARKIFAELDDLIVEFQSGSIEKVEELIKAAREILDSEE